jgi:hypothetical protein
MPTIVTGTVTVNGQPAARRVRAFSYDSVSYQLNGGNVVLSRPLGQSMSLGANGAYSITLENQYSGDVFVVAFDDYGTAFAPGLAVTVGQRIHPTEPNGFVYVAQSGGTLPATEPAWETDANTSQLVGSASFLPVPFYRPQIHGPIRPAWVPGVGDPYWSSVSLAMHFDLNPPEQMATVLHLRFEGVHGGTAFVDDTDKAVARNGGAITSRDHCKYGDASGYFDGAGDYLSLATNTAFDFGTGDLTIEMWVRAQHFIANPDGTLPCLISRSLGNWSLLLDASGALVWQDSTGAALTSSVLLGAQQWHHIAIVRASGTLTLYIDGQPGGSAANTQNYTHTSVLFIGSSTATQGFFAGYIDDLRVCKGFARYTASFLPPSEQSVYIRPFLDQKGNIVTASGPVSISTAGSMFGGASAFFTGTSPAHLSIPDSPAFDFGSGDFTIEAWIYPNMVSGLHTILRKGDSPPSFVFGIYNSELHFYGSHNGGSWDVNVFGGQPITPNEWIHVAVTKKAGVYRIFKNGVSSTPLSIPGALAVIPVPLLIGRSSHGNPFNGYIDELRITKGVARYDGDFNPPSTPFPDTE